MPTSRPRPDPTGGQWNFAGVLYQLLVSLRAGLNAVIDEVAEGEAATSAQLIVEPYQGGDAQILTRGRRRVDQIKIRRGRKPWTTRGIAETVLADLFKAHTLSGPPTEFRFVTDNLDGTDALAGFLNACRTLADQRRRPDGLDATAKRFRWGPARMTAAGLFDHVVATLAPNEADRVWDFLCSVQIAGVSQAVATAEVDVILGILVDAPQELAVRRRALGQALLELGAARNAIDGAALLRSVGLAPERLTHAARLPHLLRADLERELPRQSYNRLNDVRPEPVLPASGFGVFSGDSGQGKTWRLCQAAQAVAEAGRCVILLPAVGDVADIERQVLNRIWPADLGAPPRLERIAALLRPGLSQDGPWLTLCLDDLADPGLARALLRTEWETLGIRILITAQDRMAALLQATRPGMAIQAVPDFTMPELGERLRRAGRDPALIPDDVLSSLTRPILADLYCRIPGTEAWTGVTEYALMDHYWRWATREHRDQTQHRSDAGAILQLAGVLLDGQTPYPWPDALLRRLNISRDIPNRLITTGVLSEDENGAIALSHTRLLNWVVAEEMTRRFAEGECDITGLATQLEGLDDLATPAGERLGRRLNYVMFDLFWILSGRVAAERVGELVVLHLDAQNRRSAARHFFSEGLATIGAAVIPVLNWLARRISTPPETETPWRREIAAALAALGDDFETEVAAAAVGLIAQDIGDSRTIGLMVLKTVPAPAALDQLWLIHRERRAALALAERPGANGDWHRAYYRSNASYAALQRAVKARPDWITEAARSVETRLDAEQLIWLINGLDWESARSIWARCKTPLLALASGAHGAARVIRRLGDRDELPRVIAGLAETGVDAVLWFDALARLDPPRALVALDTLDDDELSGTGHWWMPGLARRMGPRFGEAMRRTLGRRPRSDDPILMDLGLVYSGNVDLLDPDTLDLLIDNYETCLAADAEGLTTGRITRRHIRGLLASISAPALLDRLAARAGTRFETLLTERAIANPGRVSMTVDRDGTDYHRLLAAIGGTGYDALVSAELDRPNVHGRTDGVTAAVWTRAPEVRRKLEALALDPDDDTYRQVQLMHALASHHVDTGLAAMVRRGSPVFLAAVDIREGGPPMATEILGEIRPCWIMPTPPNARSVSTSADSCPGKPEALCSPPF